MQTILGLSPLCPQAVRWQSYKLQLQARGELVNADNTVRPQDVREVMALLCDKMRVKGAVSP